MKRSESFEHVKRVSIFPSRETFHELTGGVLPFYGPYDTEYWL
jgi:hypothetical protein